MLVARHFQGYRLEFPQVLRTAEPFATQPDAVHPLCLVPNADLTQLDSRLERRGEVFHQLAEIDPLLGSEEKCNLVAVELHLHVDQLHVELARLDSAQADSQATLEILMAQLKRYEDLPRDVPRLDGFCRTDKDRFVDSEGKFFWRDGEAVFNFGKYKSSSLRDIARVDSDYLNWVVSPNRHFAQDVVDICYNAMRGEFPKKNSKG